MNGRTYVTVNASGVARMDMEMFEDGEDDDGLPIALSDSHPVG
jgi:hypothetical protein